MKRVFKYRFSRRTLYLSAFYILVLALIGLGLHSLYIGGYLSAWFVSLVVALFALMSLSIPRKIVVKKATVEILCLLDMTEIPRMEIASVQRVDPRQMRWVVPLFGGYGFFGYYGYYFDLKTFEKWSSTLRSGRIWWRSSTSTNNATTFRAPRPTNSSPCCNPNEKERPSPSALFYFRSLRTYSSSSISISRFARSEFSITPLMRSAPVP